MIVNCARCGVAVKKRPHAVKIAQSKSYKLYCSGACAGLAKRVPVETNVLNKRAYAKRMSEEHKQDMSKCIEITCAYCHTKKLRLKKEVNKRSANSYCSKQCAGKARAKTAEELALSKKAYYATLKQKRSHLFQRVECATCGGVALKLPYEIKRSKAKRFFCSTECFSRKPTMPKDAKSKGRLTEVPCTYCNKPVKRLVGHVNRSAKLGGSIFCSDVCRSMTNRTPEEKKEIKRRRYIKNQYGEYWEAAIVLRNLHNELIKRKNHGSTHII